MDPIVGGALINAGGSLLGGLLGKGPPKPSAMVVSHIKGVMDASKRFGLNPLTILGAVGGPTQGAAPPNYMGAALSDAAMFAADAFLKEGNQQALLVNQYQEQNRQLQERLTHVTLNPKVPGIYGGGDGRSDQGVSSGHAGAGGGYSSGPAGGPAGLTPIPEVEGIDPRRPVDAKPVPNSSGFMIVDNPWLGRYWVPTIDGDEPVDLLDIPSLGPLGGQAAYQHGDKMTLGGGRESAPAYTAESWRKAVEDGKKGAVKRPKKRPYERVDKYGKPLPLKSSQQSWSW